jgi:hypothetical protein
MHQIRTEFGPVQLKDNMQRNESTQRIASRWVAKIQWWLANHAQLPPSPHTCHHEHILASHIVQLRINIGLSALLVPQVLQKV